MAVLYGETKTVNRSAYRVVNTRAKRIWDLAEMPLQDLDERIWNGTETRLAISRKLMFTLNIRMKMATRWERSAERRKTFIWSAKWSGQSERKQIGRNGNEVEGEGDGKEKWSEEREMGKEINNEEGEKWQNRLFDWRMSIENENEERGKDAEE